MKLEKFNWTGRYNDCMLDGLDAYLVLTKRGFLTNEQVQWMDEWLYTHLVKDMDYIL